VWNTYGPTESTVGWERAYRTGDLVRAEAAGLLIVDRADDQVKISGRRVELARGWNLLSTASLLGLAALPVLMSIPWTRRRPADGPSWPGSRVSTLWVPSVRSRKRSSFVASPTP
jgi:hypothetical protein